MAAKGIRSQKTRLYFVTNDVSPVLVYLGAFTNFNGLGGSHSEIDATNFESDAKEYFAGLEDNGTFSADLNLDPSDSSHQKLMKVKDDGTNNQFALCLSDGTSPPTLDSHGAVVAPSGRTSFVFTASVQQFTLSGAADNIIKGQIQLRITGSVAKNWKT